jgi:hypothetical protein
MPCGGVPDLHGLVIAGRSDALVIRGPGDGGDAIVVTVVSRKGSSSLLKRSGNRDRVRARDRAGW